MKRLTTVVTTAILLVGSVVLGMGDTRISIADTSVPTDELTSSGCNSSASATITITMTGVLNE